MTARTDRLQYSPKFRHTNKTDQSSFGKMQPLHKKSKSDSFNRTSSSSFSSVGAGSTRNATSFKKHGNLHSQSSILEPQEVHMTIREELFDPSLIFVVVYSCCYWDENDRIRKGKIFLTKTEMLFKCSRMPFVRRVCAWY